MIKHEALLGIRCNWLYLEVGHSEAPVTVFGMFGVRKQASRRDSTERCCVNTDCTGIVSTVD